YDNSRDIEILKNQIKFLEEELKSNIFLVSPPSTTSKTKELDIKMLNYEIDIAVHSLKDVS
ncbi:hypothetical protein KKP89_01955, partial [Methanothermococcus sp. SCGC AD-155-N22]|nr:hypothetical protein [Methanothermococcus sp. SCGC AD-155-N22]